jgi:hypothetical protein
MSCGPCGQRALVLIGEPIYYPTWIYPMGAFVVVAGVLYKSIQDDNEGNNPQESPEFWKRTTVLEELRDPDAHNVLNTLGYLPWEDDVAYPANKGRQHNGLVCVCNTTNTGEEPPDTPGTFNDDPVVYEFWNVFATYQDAQEFLINAVVGG